MTDDQGAESNPAPRAAVFGFTSSDGSGVPVWILVGSCAIVAAGVYLRFWTRSQLWLDEALTVNIANLPVAKLHAALHRDGSPPLYYLLLHFWIRLFGTSNLAVRSLSGAIGVITIPVSWIAGRRLGGSKVAGAAMVLVASSPFAIRYSTEARMYSLIMLEAFLGYIILDSIRKGPKASNISTLVVVTAALLYTHYWSIYLIAATVVLLAVSAFRGNKVRESWIAVAAIGGGSLLFIPWVPTLLFQLAHTGTPWSEPVSFAAMVNAVSEFSGGVTNEGRALGLVFFALAGIGLFGMALDNRRIELDLRSRPRARLVTFITVATLAIAILVGIATRSGFQARYASVVFPTFMLLVGLGTLSFSSDRVRWSVLSLAIVLGFIGSAYNVTTQRSQAVQVAKFINSNAKPDDVVAYCPDQLGPDTSRILRTDLRQVSFPRGNPPQFVNWIDYANSVAAANPQEFAQSLLSMAGGQHTIYLVWGAGYRGLKTTCQQIIADLDVARPGVVAPVVQDVIDYYESASLYVYRP